MNWTLEDVYDLNHDDYEELTTWINEQAERAEHGESINADDLVAAMDAKAAQNLDTDGDD